MGFQFAIITSFLGKLKDRFTFYQEPRNLEEKLKLTKQIEGVLGVELVYPYDFEDPDQTKQLLHKYNLQVAAVNIDIKGETRWNRRALTAETSDIRRKAIEYLSTGAELSREIGSNLITVCPLQDGYDYHFEMDYRKVWKYLLDGIKEVAISHPEIKISLEYKLREPLVHYLLGNVNSTLYVCLKLGIPNVGVTLDVGHALFAGENPAESLVILAEEQRLFHVHINDNDGKWDWDLISGSRNFLSYLEFLYYLQKYNYKGWVSLDVTPKQRSPIEVFTTSIHITQKIAQLARGLDESLIEENIKTNNPQKTLSYLYDSFLSR